MASGKPTAKDAMILLSIVAMVGLGIGAIVLTCKLGGELMAKIPVRDQPMSAQFDLQQRSRLEMWTELEVQHPSISYRTRNDSLPHVLDYTIEIEKDGQPLTTLQCNPFDVHIQKSSHAGGNYDGENGRYYDGRMNGCALIVEPGHYEVITRRTWLNPDDTRVRFRKTKLLVRASAHD